MSCLSAAHDGDKKGRGIAQALGVARLLSSSFIFVISPLPLATTPIIGLIARTEHRDDHGLVNLAGSG